MRYLLFSLSSPLPLPLKPHTHTQIRKEQLLREKGGGGGKGYRHIIFSPYAYGSVETPTCRLTKIFYSVQDAALLPWLQQFQKSDLYSKSSAIPDMHALRSYYKSLVDKYCPGVLRW